MARETLASLREVIAAKDARIAELETEVATLGGKLKGAIKRLNLAKSQNNSSEQDTVAPEPRKYGVGQASWVEVDGRKEKRFEAYVDSPAEVKAWWAAHNAAKSGTTDSELALPVLPDDYLAARQMEKALKEASE